MSGVGGHLDILLSEHINTDQEKAAFIAHAYDALGQALGQLASVFYVAVHEIPAQAGSKSEWDAARAVFDRFAAADAYLFSVPMWNAGVPYVLKQWIDIISQPGWLFSFTPDAGYSGLIRGKKAAVIYTSGVYQPGAPRAYGADFHVAFFNVWLRFAGFIDVAEIRWQPTVLTATRDTDKTAALQRAAEAGSHF